MAFPKKILIAEDIEMNRRLIKDILRYYGYEIIEAENGQVACQMAEEQKPDLIVMDLQMPVMNGIDALKRLRSSPTTKDIKVIAVTSFAMKGDREKFLKAGFAEFISKPLNTREFPKLIKKLLNNDQ